MIPKIIHYCWFGRGPMPADALRCIESWRRTMPGYEIRRWDEDTFDIDSNLYVSQAWKARKFAFVSDYVRLHALATCGGIYMDTDVETLKSYDPFLHHTAFTGFEGKEHPVTGTMASVKGGRWVTDMLEEYSSRSFIMPDGTMDTTTNVIPITAYMRRAGVVMDNTLQEIDGLVTVYPTDYFCPKDHTTGKIRLTPNTVCIHHFACSWLPWHVRFRHGIKLTLLKLTGRG